MEYVLSLMVCVQRAEDQIVSLCTDNKLPPIADFSLSPVDCPINLPQQSYTLFRSETTELHRYLPHAVGSSSASTLMLIFQASLGRALSRKFESRPQLFLFSKRAVAQTLSCYFRPISLSDLPVCAKILWQLEHIIYSNVLKHLQSQGM